MSYNLRTLSTEAQLDKLETAWLRKDDKSFHEAIAALRDSCTPKRRKSRSPRKREPRDSRRKSKR